MFQAAVSYVWAGIMTLNHNGPLASPAKGRCLQGPPVFSPVLEVNLKHSADIRRHPFLDVIKFPGLHSISPPNPIISLL